MPRSPSKVKMVLACGEPYRVSFPALLSWELMSPKIHLLWKRSLGSGYEYASWREGRAYGDLD